MGFCPNRRRKNNFQAKVDHTTGDKFDPKERQPKVDRIRGSADDTNWVYRLDRVTDDGTQEIARVYGWNQIPRCVESLELRKTDRIIATPLYPVR